MFSTIYKGLLRNKTKALRDCTKIRKKDGGNSIQREGCNTFKNGLCVLPAFHLIFIVLIAKTLNSARNTFP